MKRSILMILIVAVLMVALFPCRVSAAEGGGTYTYIFEYDRSKDKKDGTLDFYDGSSDTWERIKFSNYGYKVTIEVKVNVPTGYYLYCNIGGGVPYIGGYDITNGKTVSEDDMIKYGMTYSVTSSHSNITYSDFAINYNYMSDCTVSSDWMLLDYDTSSGDTIYTMFYCNPSNVVYTHNLSLDGDIYVMWSNIVSIMGSCLLNTDSFKLSSTNMDSNYLAFNFECVGSVSNKNISDIVISANGNIYTIPIDNVEIRYTSTVRRGSDTTHRHISILTSSIADYIGVESAKLDYLTIGVDFEINGSWCGMKYYTLHLDSGLVTVGDSSNNSIIGDITDTEHYNGNASNMIYNTIITNQDNLNKVFNTGIGFLDAILNSLYNMVSVLVDIVQIVVDFISYIASFASMFFGSSVGQFISLGLVACIALRVFGR